MSWLRRIFGGGSRQPRIELPPREVLEQAHLSELHSYAAQAGVERYRLMRKQALVEELVQHSGRGNGNGAEVAAASGRQARHERPTAVSADRGRAEEPEGESEPEPEVGEEEEAESTYEIVGVVDVTRRGHGFLRVSGLTRSKDDPYLSRSQIRKFELRSGDDLVGLARHPRRSERYPSLVQIELVNGEAPGAQKRALPFQERRATRATTPLHMARSADDVGGRMLELITPLGAGERLIVAAPVGAGATSLLRELAGALEAANDVTVIAALIDVRPEELSEWEPGKRMEVHGSSIDASQGAHTGLAELAVERARRKAERGQNVVVALDSATRLARAYDAGRSSRRSAQGQRTDAATSVKRLVACARNAEEGGSLTIITVVRTESGSDLDANVYEVLSDVANAEIVLDAELAREGKHPAIDLGRSVARSDEQLVPAESRHRLNALRSVVRSLKPREAWEFLVERIRATESNEQLLRD